MAIFAEFENSGEEFTYTSSKDVCLDGAEIYGVGFYQLDNLYSSYSPIEKAIVKFVGNEGVIDYIRYEPRYKPVWLTATIRLKDLRTGETTEKNPKLAKMIRDRGVNQDDCGHIIAASLGGKMVYFNLFPQNKWLNRGHHDKYWLWRATELCAQYWVIWIPEKYNPRVKIQHLLSYNEKGERPDRSQKIKYHVAFLMDDNEKRGEEKIRDHDENCFIISLVNITVQSLGDFQRNPDVYAVVEAKINAIRSRAGFYNRKLADTFLESLKGIILPPKKSKSNRQTRRAQVIRESQTSWLDFIPVVGGIKMGLEGLEDIRDGNTVSGIITVAAGVGSLALDFVSVGALSTLTSGLKGAVLKEVGKRGLKKAAITAGVSIGNKAATRATCRPKHM